MRDLHCRVFAKPWRYQHYLEVLFYEYKDGLTYCAKPAEMALADEGGEGTSAFTLNITAAQELMDSLWSCGVRPTEGAGTAGAMAAVQAHLKDLQRLVFKGKP